MKNFPASQTVRTAHETDAQLPTIRLKHWAYIGWYQVRLIYSWAYPVLLLVPLGIALLLIRQYQPEARRSFYLIFEFLLPLAVSFLFVPLILREQQQRTLALVSVTQCPLPFLFVIRATVNYIVSCHIECSIGIASPFISTNTRLDFVSSRY